VKDKDDGRKQTRTGRWNRKVTRKQIREVKSEKEKSTVSLNKGD
jgi:hypothetical protein